MSERELGGLSAEELGGLEGLSEEEIKDLEEFQGGGSGESFSSPKELEGLIESGGISYSMVENPEMTVSMTSDGMYHYDLPDGTYFQMSIPVGMVTTGAVAFVPGEGQSVLEVYRGKEAVYPDEYLFTEQGIYRLTLLSAGNGENDGNAGGIVNCRAEVSFQIIKPSTAELKTLVSPREFWLTGLTLNGSEAETAQEVPLSRDGSYVCTWTAKSDDAIRYQTEFTLDTMAPELIFSKDVTHGAVKPPLMMSATEKGCTLKAEMGIEQVILDNWELTQGGVYRLTVEDPAGNARSYDVVVRMATGKYMTALVIMLAVLLAGAGIWFRFLRRHMQVL